MGRNERCWCGSGKKWKHCHLGREQQKPVNIHEHNEALRAEFGKGRCSHPEASSNACGGRVIKAHTIQRNAGLAAIAENGHVISLRSAFERLRYNEGRVIPAKIGINKASTFPGFCARHDFEMFQSIENGTVVLTNETAFLLSFRALAYERLQKEAAFRTIRILRDLDKGKPFEDQCNIQRHINMSAEGTKRALDDLNRWKRAYDDAFLRRQFDKYRFYCVAFAQAVPVMACGAFYPEFDFRGQPLQRIGRGRAPFEHITFNLTVINGRGVAALGWVEGDSGPAASFVNSFAAIPSPGKADAAVRLAIEYLENTFLRPSWWQSLGERTRDAILHHAVSGIGPSAPERGSASLRSDGVTYWRADVVEEIK